MKKPYEMGIASTANDQKFVLPPLHIECQPLNRMSMFRYLGWHNVSENSLTQAGDRTEPTQRHRHTESTTWGRDQDHQVKEHQTNSNVLHTTYPEVSKGPKCRHQKGKRNNVYSYGATLQ